MNLRFAHILVHLNCLICIRCSSLNLQDFLSTVSKIIPMMLHLCLHVSKLPTSFFWHRADGGPARVLSNLVRRCSRITSHPRISPSKHTHILIPLYSIIRPMCLGPQRKQAFLYMTRMSLIFMEVNKCTRMEGVFHSWRLTMGPLCSLIS